MTLPESFDFDVALSFAGEDRDFVTDVNEALKKAGIVTFLDSDHLAETWGEDLVEFFDGVYRKRSRFAILFISRHYAEKIWARQERRSALARALEERGAYVLPVRLDDTELDGLRPTVGYLDTRRIGIETLVRTLLAKLAGGPDGFLSWPGDRGARTERELEEIFAKRPPGWEWLGLAGVLHVETAALNGLYLDHELGYAEASGERLTDEEVAPFLERAMDDARAIMAQLMRTMEPEVQERAVGPRGEPGDPDRIRQLGRRWAAAYAAMLQWSARIRGASHSARFDRLFDICARFLDESIDSYRAWEKLIAGFADGIPEALSSNRPHVLNATLEVSIPEELSTAISDELDRLSREPEE